MATIFALIALQLVGEIIVGILGIPIPGAVIGLVLLYAILTAYGTVPDETTRTAGFLHEHFGLLFVPAGVGVVAYLPLIGEQWEGIVAALAISVVVTIAVTALVMSRMSQRLATRPRSELGS